MIQPEIVPLSPGEELLNYHIEGVLGQGGFSITYLATDMKTGAKVVIKENIPDEEALRSWEHYPRFFVPPDRLNSDKKGSYQWRRDNFIGEVQRLIKLRHPYVVRVLMAFESTDTNTQYYVMPYETSRSLEVVLRVREQVDEDRLRNWLNCLLAALDYLHGKGVLHRDIKPSNILIRPDDSPLLIDFGSSRPVRAPLKTRIVSDYYSSPEQCGRRPEKPSSDLYSLAAVFYELITGRRVPEALDRMERDHYIPLGTQRNLLILYDQTLLLSIDRALRLDPDGRFPSAASWRDVLYSSPEEGRSIPSFAHAARGDFDQDRIAASDRFPDDIAVPDDGEFAPTRFRAFALLAIIVGAFLIILVSVSRKKEQKDDALQGVTDRQARQGEALRGVKERQEAKIGGEERGEGSKYRREGEERERMQEERSWLEAEKKHRRPTERVDGAGDAYELSHWFFKGEGMLEGEKKSLYRLKKAAGARHSKGAYELGRHYEHGDIEEAGKLFRKAADQGSARGRYKLSQCYREGRGVDKNLIEAEKLYEEAKKGGYDEWANVANGSYLLFPQD